MCLNKNYNEIKERLYAGEFVKIENQNDIEFLFQVLIDCKAIVLDSIITMASKLTFLLSKTTQLFMRIDFHEKTLVVLNEIPGFCKYIDLADYKENSQEQTQVEEAEEKLDDNTEDDETSLLELLEGCIVVERNHKRYVVMNQEIISMETAFPLSDYRISDSSIAHKRHRSCDIIQVYKKPEGYGLAKALYCPIEELELVVDYTF